MIIKLAVLLATLTGAIQAFAYPNFIGKGYHNCLTCHYNPFGNGPLNDYGRGVAATGLASRALFPKSISDETLSKRSGFLFFTPKSKLIRPSLDYRGATIRRGLETDDTQEKFINMQVDASLSSEFGPSNKFVATYTYSIVPDNSIADGGASKGYKNAKAGEHLTFSREHYLGYKFRKDMAVYLGKMDKVFGIRTPEHTAFARVKTGNDQYGSTHGVVGHLSKEKFDWGVQFYVGDMEKEKEFQATGIATKFEYSTSDKTRMGISILSEAEETNKNLAYSFLTKMGVGKNSSLMFELGQVINTPDGGDSKTQQYIFLQNHFYLMRGLYFLTTYEQHIADTSGASESHRISPGIQYYPMQRVELRADLTNAKDYTPGSATKDTWEFLGQIHLWF